MKTTRLRVVSDGTPRGTKVTTEDGTLVKGVQFANWHLDVSGHARLQIEVSGVAADVVGLVEAEDASFLEDPTALVSLEVPQDPPEGPGFPADHEGTALLTDEQRAERDAVIRQRAFEPGYVCPTCGTPYHDPMEICAGTDETGEHIPTSVVDRKVPDETEGA